MDVSNIQHENSSLATETAPTVALYHQELAELDKQESQLCERRAILHSKLEGIIGIAATSRKQASQLADHLEAARYSANIHPKSTVSSSSTSTNTKKHKLPAEATQSNPNKRKKAEDYPHHPSNVPYDALLASKVKSIHDVSTRRRLNGELVLVKGIIKSIVDLNPNNPNKKALLLSPLTIAGQSYPEYLLPYQSKVRSMFKRKVKKLFELVGKEMSFLARAKVAAAKDGDDKESMPDDEEEGRKIDIMQKEVFHLHIEGQPWALYSSKKKGSNKLEEGEDGVREGEGDANEDDTMDDEEDEDKEDDDEKDAGYNMPVTVSSTETTFPVEATAQQSSNLPKNNKRLKGKNNPYHPSNIPYDTLLASKVKSIHNSPTRRSLSGQLVLVEGIIKSINSQKKTMLLSPLTIADQPYPEYTLPFQHEVQKLFKRELNKLGYLEGKEMSFVTRAIVKNDKSIPDEDKLIAFSHNQVYHLYIEKKPWISGRTRQEVGEGDDGDDGIEEEAQEKEEVKELEDDKDNNEGDKEEGEGQLENSVELYATK